MSNFKRDTKLRLEKGGNKPKRVDPSKFFTGPAYPIPAILPAGNESLPMYQENNPLPYTSQRMPTESFHMEGPDSFMDRHYSTINSRYPRPSAHMDFSPSSVRNRSSQQYPVYNMGSLPGDVSSQDEAHNDRYFHSNAIFSFGNADMEPHDSLYRDPYHSESYPYHPTYPSGTHRYAERLPNQHYLAHPEFYTPSISPIPDSPPPFFSQHPTRTYSQSYSFNSLPDTSFSPEFSSSPPRSTGFSPDHDTRSWRSATPEKQKNKRHRKSVKEEPASEKESEPTSIQPAHQFIEQNRGKLLNLALQQSGCRHLQMALDQEGVSLVDILYEEIGGQMDLLMVNPFGNYLFQKMVEMSSDAQRRKLLATVQQSIHIVAKDMYGTRCVQKLIRLCRLPDMVDMLLNGICPYVVELCSDINGNHVIKRCLTGMTPDSRARLEKEVVNHCIEISKEMYGCSIVQKCIEIVSGDQANRLFSIIEAHALELMRDRYANYVIQFLIENASPEVSLRFCRCVLTHVEELSKEKCSSNVVEKSLKRGDEAIRDAIIDEIVNASDLQALLLDGYANYVIQKALVLSNMKQRERLTKAIAPYVNSLAESKVGRHILQKIPSSVFNVSNDQYQ